jgi:hypothetical protein
MIIKNIAILFFFCGFVSCASVKEEPNKEEVVHRTFEGSSSAVIR